MLRGCWDGYLCFFEMWISTLSLSLSSLPRRSIDRTTERTMDLTTPTSTHTTSHARCRSRWRSSTRVRSSTSSRVALASHSSTSPVCGCARWWVVVSFRWLTRRDGRFDRLATERALPRIGELMQQQVTDRSIRAPVDAR